MQKISGKFLLVLALIGSISACVWEEPGRYGRGHDDRGEHHHDHGDRDGHGDSRRDDDRGDHR